MCSQAALQAIQSPTINCNSVVDCHYSLLSLSERVHTLKLVWIKAHVGHPGNELADTYANIGTIDTTKAATTYTSMNTIKTLVTESIYHNWKEKWLSYPGCRQTKYFFPEPSSIKYKQIGRLARSQLAVSFGTRAREVRLLMLVDQKSTDTLLPVCSSVNGLSGGREVVQRACVSRLWVLQLCLTLMQPELCVTRTPTNQPKTHTNRASLTVQCWPS